MDKLEQALLIFGDEYISEMGDILIKENKIATRDLLNSLDTRILKTGFGTSYTLKIVAEAHLKYVDEGRKPGSTPPPVLGEKGKSLREWVRIKGMPKGAVWGVAKNIGKNGIKPTNVISRALKKVETNVAFRRLEDGVGDWVDDLIAEKLIGLSNNKNKNITFR